jgi:hypothetical protein
MQALQEPTKILLSIDPVLPGLAMQQQKVQ